MPRYIIILLFCMFLVGFVPHNLLKSQEPVPGISNWYASLQLQCYLNPIKSSGTNHLTLSVAAGTAIRPNHRSVALWLQTSLNFYANGLGTPVLDSYRDENEVEHRRKWQFDWINSIIGVVEWGPEFDPASRINQQVITFNQMSASALVPKYHHNLYYGTHFLWNSSNRHQQIGVIGGHTPWAGLNYYNDGLLGRLVCDQYDRFWTGGGMLRLTAFDIDADPGEWQQRTQLRYQFDRFTHDVQGGYRLSNILLIPNADDPNFEKLLFNNGMTSLDIQYGPYSLGVVFLGRSRWDVQDAIHRMLGYPLHLTYAPSEFLVRMRGNPIIIQNLR